ncbi:ABC transporter substrate-binding protein [bacterium]|nr:ABC transporter substrate-binding protein [bacterium]
MAAVLLALALFASACRDERDPGAAVIALEGQPVTLDPRFAIDAYSTRILPLLYDRVIDIGPDGAPAPALATSWESPDGGATWRFSIREGVVFSDGTPLSASDIAANLNWLRDPDNGAPAQASLADIASVDAPDETTLVVALSRPFSPFLMSMARAVIPEERLADPAFAEHPVGSGAYVLESMRPGRDLTLAANPNYHGPAPSIARLRFEVLPHETTRMLKLMKGEADLLQNCTPPYALEFLSSDPGVVTERSPGINYAYIGFNLDDPRGIASKRGVRRAIAHAIDREAIVETLLDGQARPANALLSPEHWAYAANARDYDYDPALAMRLLDEAGFPDPDGAGPLPRFELSFKTSTDRLRNRIADAIADQLAQVGIAVEKRSYEWGVFFADIRKGNFQTYSLSWVGVIDPDHLYYVFHSESLPPAGANRGRVRLPAVDRLLTAARRTAPASERAALYTRAQEILADEAVYVSLWWADNVIARRERLVGFEALPGGEYTSLATARLAEAP